MPPNRERSREAIVDAAARLFGSDGYEAVRVEDIARAAGVSRATFYNHFGERSDVLAALFDRLLGDGDGEDAPVPDRAPLVEQVRAVAHGAAARMLEDEQLARLLYSLPIRHEALLRPDEPVTPAVFRRIHALVEAGVERGEVRRDVPVDLLCAHVHGAIETAMRAWAEGRTDDPLGHLDVLVDLALSGIVAR